jgi:hypothetical protein
MSFKASIFMKWFSTLSLMLLTGCAEVMPGLFKAVDDIETDNAIKIEIEKEALQKDTDIHITVDVLNKDDKPVAKS